jgi:hypothetical protein
VLAACAREGACRGMVLIGEGGPPPIHAILFIPLFAYGSAGPIYISLGKRGTEHFVSMLGQRGKARDIQRERAAQTDRQTHTHTTERWTHTDIRRTICNLHKLLEELIQVLMDFMPLFFH